MSEIRASSATGSMQEKGGSGSIGRLAKQLSPDCSY